MIEILERLAGAGIQLLPETGITTHFLFERDGFVALVERKADGFGSIGAPGLLTERGLAMLVWREQQPWFIAKGFEQSATPEQVTALRKFAADLDAALNA